MREQSSSTDNHIICVAGETSGDIHGALLVESLKKINPSLSFSGLGGPRMAQQGVELYKDMTSIAVVGFLEVLQHYPEFRRIFYHTLEEIKQRRPKAVILIDYPGFNLRLAKEIKKLGIKVIYFISPQVWAWKENRVHTIKKVVDQMLVLFPFEKEFYAKYGFEAEFVGHPFLDEIKVTIPKADFLRTHHLSSRTATIALLPGSREKEIERILPVMLDAVKKIYDQHINTQVILLRAPAIEKSWLYHMLAKYEFPVEIINQDTYNGINASDVCLVASGTATLETAVLEKPMIVVYKTSSVTAFLAKRFIKIPYISLVNIIAGRKIVSEYLQEKADASKIAKEMQALLEDDALRDKQVREMKAIKTLLGEHGASDRAAKKICRFLKI